MEEIFEEGEVIISKAGRLLLFGEDMSRELLLFTSCVIASGEALVVVNEEELAVLLPLIRIRPPPPLITSLFRWPTTLAVVGGRNESDSADESQCGCSFGSGCWC